MTRPYPHTPGHRGVPTSIDASIKIETPAMKTRQRALEVFKKAGLRGLTMDECCERIGLKRRKCQPRISELKTRNLIVPATRIDRKGQEVPIRRKNDDGNWCEVLRHHEAKPQMELFI